MTKEEIFDKEVGEYHRTLSPLNYSNVCSAMDEYAKQQVIEFQAWTNLNGWFWSPNSWINYHGDPTPHTTEKLYAEFIKQYNQ